MAIDLDVIPTSPKQLRWMDVKDAINGSGAISDQVGLDVTDLFDITTGMRVSGNEILKCPGYYRFQFNEPTTLSLSLEPNVGGIEDDDYFDDFSRNLTSDIKSRIRQGWNDAGYSIKLSSKAGRPKGELAVLAHLAMCFAKATSGYVVVMDNGIFQHSVGMYTPDEFTA